jgi:hypothetical protein
MSNEIKAAIRATIAALRDEIATGRTEPGHQRLVEDKIAAAEKIVGNEDVAAQPRRRRGQ